MASSRRQYPFHLIEPKWQQTWEQQQAFRAFNPGDSVPNGHPFGVRHDLSGKVADRKVLPPKFYILDMFPYPSGAGLHVGHPEGYTATDILARYRRAQGFNVLHPMGWDAFGLPAEQYAVKTGQHPRKTTEENIANFTRQIKSLGFSYDWSREIATTDVDYFKWTQWIFLKLYNSWFNPVRNKAEPIETLEYPPELRSAGVGQASRLSQTPNVSSEDRDRRDACPTDLEAARRAYRDSKRLAYKAMAPVNWSPDLATILSNEEVEEWESKGFKIERKQMPQWMLRITAYAEKLLTDLDTIDWSDSLKEMQRNWIGRSEGAEVDFAIADCQLPIADSKIRVFTTRPDTLFGATYMVLSPEHKLVPQITTAEQKKAVEDYQAYAASKSDLERTELAKEKTGVFTGAYAINPVNGEKIPIWIADYVLASYGTGAIMAVPAHDERDFEFAKKFNLKINIVVTPPESWLRAHALPALKTEALSELQRMWSEGAIDANNNVLTDAFAKAPAFCDEGFVCNSANSEISLDGLPTAEAKKKIAAWLEEKGLGKKTVNFKLRDWLFSRQRYWGEPFPIIWKKDVAGNLYHEALPESALPVLPPTLEDYKPTPDGQPPLARAKDWVNLPDGSMRETNTMPQWAGSCWYYLRYLDAKNANAFVGKEAEAYWMGAGQLNELNELHGERVKSGSGPHLTDLTNHPFNSTPGVDLYVGGTEHAVLHLLYARFWHKVLFDLGYVSTPEPFFKLVNQGLILGEDGQKMSKSRGNVVNPDDILKEFGADAFRLYEMFMGPLQDTKPWSTKGVEGVYRFLGRVWRLFVDEKAQTAFEQAETTAATPNQELLDHILLDGAITDDAATPAQLKTLHACIKKVTEDLDGMRFNTAISAMMEFVNAALHWQTKPLAVMKTFLQLLAPFAPHLAEELWARLHSTFGQRAPSLPYGAWPKFDPALLVESEIEIPVSVNGKMRDVIKVAADADNAALETAAKASEKIKAFIDGKPLKKVIIVPKKMVNIVVG
ncbi:MAG TPA: class I tRNA ligase family protein [Verrucomicrobiae bacterium]|nr:class I tRNA ligase family protein [Verrucomicrobiae bacterium]